MVTSVSILEDGSRLICREIVEERNKWSALIDVSILAL
jgi:hypothetical protein